ncbi:GAF and ANTAR domain-containing protein [Kribbella sp. GL6]|uniref:GAF and ANTAR domain-containing protein n=1 Tax=Kribbella sp. GL6 TaxID=3419765 RepID=UPI003D020F4C
MVGGLSVWIGPAQEQAELQRARAGRAAAIACRHEDLATTAPEALRSVHIRLAELHRRSEERHLTTARLHDAHVQRLTRWYSATDMESERPRLISAVAELVGARGAGLTLLGSERTEASSIASGPLAAAAQDLELTLGEGPVHDSTAAGLPVIATAASLARRWPHYSPAVRALGVHSLAVVPLGSGGRCVGALAVFDPPDADRPDPLTGDLEGLADALTHTMLLTEQCLGQVIDASGTASAAYLLGSPNHRVVLHQAVGMVAAQCECSIEDAFSLVRARAFADDVPVTDVARLIVDKRLRLDEDRDR